MIIYTYLFKESGEYKCEINSPKNILTSSNGFILTDGIIENSNTDRYNKITTTTELDGSNSAVKSTTEIVSGVATSGRLRESGLKLESLYSPSSTLIRNGSYDLYVNTNIGKKARIYTSFDGTNYTINFSSTISAKLVVLVLIWQ